MKLRFNSLPYEKILDLSELKAIADDKINISKKLKFVLERIENIAEKVQNIGYPHFLLFLQCFQKVPFSWSLKVETVW